ncbi:hypothetical protein Lfu02_73990 [Longispora fulva]|nr:hypothetical protein Lfu02_73990 [Longispora fulva]
MDGQGDSGPAGRPRRNRIAAIWIGVVLVLVLGAVAWWAFPDHDGTLSGAGQPRSPATPTGGSPAPGATASRSPGPTVPDSSIADTTRQLSAQWGVPLVPGATAYSAKFVKPGTSRSLWMVVGHAVGDSGDGLGSLICETFGPDLVIDQAALQDLKACLAPVLRGPEKTSVPEWLDRTAPGLASDGFKDEEFATFRLHLIHRGTEGLLVQLKAK